MKDDDYPRDSLALPSHQGPPAVISALPPSSAVLHHPTTTVAPPPYIPQYTPTPHSPIQYTAEPHRPLVYTPKPHVPVQYTPAPPPYTPSQAAHPPKSPLVPHPPYVPYDPHLAVHPAPLHNVHQPAISFPHVSVAVTVAPKSHTPTNKVVHKPIGHLKVAKVKKVPSVDYLKKDEYVPKFSSSYQTGGKDVHAKGD